MIFYGCPDQLFCYFPFLFPCIKEPSLFMEGGGGGTNCFPPKAMPIVFISPAGYFNIQYHFYCTLKNDIALGFTSLCNKNDIALSKMQ